MHKSSRIIKIRSSRASVRANVRKAINERRIRHFLSHLKSRSKTAAIIKEKTCAAKSVGVAIPMLKRWNGMPKYVLDCAILGIMRNKAPKSERHVKSRPVKKKHFRIFFQSTPTAPKMKMAMKKGAIACARWQMK